ncbi:putative TsaA-like domain-containing protein [Lupinus albus]|uniref:Putative TsaA-like domain-containing protein n=1 Tax=Lupinus albus TaxID=3870 RepID=A0A6A4PJH2_LUPAL|nr:putative TsaA-like domain-containing protein [Lupinus albus]
MKGIFISEANGLRLGITLTITFAVISISSAISAYVFKRKSNALNSKIRELEASLKSSIDKCVSERQGRIRAQQALRKELTQPKSENLKLTYYPMSPIGTIHSCFSTRNGTPRQPLLVPLARACLVFNTTRVPPASLEGLADYSHCWVLYVFHLNTDLEKLWKHPSQSGFKAKVRVPRLKGGRMGVFATRSPHRPCPIGLTVAKVEAVHENMMLLSGVDLVDGTPVLDVKPYVPYCDSIKEAAVPNWLTEDNLLTVASVSFSGDFTSALENCWTIAEKKSLYASPGEFQSLIKQVLSWDIRSLSQRNRPHDALSKKENDELLSNTSDVDEHQDETAFVHEREQNSLNSKEVIYHLILDGLNISYKIDQDANVIVESVSNSDTFDNSSNSCNYLTWKDKLQ